MGLKVNFLKNISVCSLIVPGTPSEMESVSVSFLRFNLQYEFNV